jgi:hypothetical protein
MTFHFTFCLLFQRKTSTSKNLWTRLSFHWSFRPLSTLKESSTVFIQAMKELRVKAMRMGQERSTHRILRKGWFSLSTPLSRHPSGISQIEDRSLFRLGMCLTSLSFTLSMMRAWLQSWKSKSLSTSLTFWRQMRRTARTKNWWSLNPSSLKERHLEMTTVVSPHYLSLISILKITWSSSRNQCLNKQRIMGFQLEEMKMTLRLITKSKLIIKGTTLYY